MNRVGLVKSVASVVLVMFVGLFPDAYLLAGTDAPLVKGVLTVRKDGKGDFTRIVPALMLSEPGEIIEIRDSAVYRESLNLAAFPKRTIRAGKGQSPTLIGIVIMGDHVVLDGLKITYPSKVRGGESTIRSAGKKGWVVRNCNIYDIPYNSQAFYMVNGTRDAKIICNRIHGGRGGAVYITVNYDKGGNLIANNVIYNCGGIAISGNSPNNRIVSNTFYKSGIVCRSASTAIENNIVVSGRIRSNGPVRYNCLWKSDCKGLVEKENITQDPLLADPDKGDFHLKSRGGRWNPKARNWERDKATSTCIDAGDPKTECKNEPRGKRINIGAYGNTACASAGREDKWPLPQPKADVFALPKVTPGPRKDYAALMKRYGWIQSKIDALEPKGGIVNIPEGTHTVVAPIVIEKSNVILRGAGADKTVIKGLSKESGNITVGLLGKDISGVVIENLSIGRKGRKGVCFVYVTKSSVRNVNGAGVYLRCCEDITVKGCKINNIFTDRGKDLIITDNVCSHCRGWWGIDIQGTNHATVSRNVCHSNGNGGIKLYSGAVNCIITDNLCYGNSNEGISVFGASGSRIERNICRNNRWFGIMVGYPYRNNGVIIRNNRIYANLKGGIEFRPSRYEYRNKVAVESNVIDSNGGDGISLPVKHRRYTVTARNNIITNNKGFGLNRTSTVATLISNYNDIWGNAKGAYNGVSKGAGDISVNPLFADAAKGEFHLKSKAGRWDPKADKWVSDAVVSPCIDAGAPNSDWSVEPAPNGGRINMGVYGNTKEASKGGK